MFLSIKLMFVGMTVANLSIAAGSVCFTHGAMHKISRSGYLRSHHVQPRCMYPTFHYVHYIIDIVSFKTKKHIAVSNCLIFAAGFGLHLAKMADVEARKQVRCNILAVTHQQLQVLMAPVEFAAFIEHV